eukprot:1151045-Pelagomonas_calceolata.AAC.6
MSHRSSIKGAPRGYCALLLLTAHSGGTATQNPDCLLLAWTWPRPSGCQVWHRQTGRDNRGDIGTEIGIGMDQAMAIKISSLALTGKQKQEKSRQAGFPSYVRSCAHDSAEPDHGAGLSMPAHMFVKHNGCSHMSAHSKSSITPAQAELATMARDTGDRSERPPAKTTNCWPSNKGAASIHRERIFKLSCTSRLARRKENPRPYIKLPTCRVDQAGRSRPACRGGLDAARLGRSALVH